MKKLVTFTLIGTMACVAPALADVNADSNKINADVAAIQKDNDALAKDLAALKKDRDAKAAAKANGQYGKQAADSVAIGADQTAIGEKKVEKNVDTKILTHDQNQMNNDVNNVKTDPTANQ
jgi:hypothetical protein